MVVDQLSRLVDPFLIHKSWSSSGTSHEGVVKIGLNWSLFGPRSKDLTSNQHDLLKGFF